MFQTLKLGRVFGIGLFVHPTFWLLPLFLLFTANGFEDAFLSVGVLFAVFGCVALHELGHALAARGYGIDTRDITLYPLGGIARLENMPERAWPEIVVALAGPAVNVVIAALLFGWIAVGGLTISPEVGTAPSLEDLFVSRLLVANVMLVLFNLIPAFPMDGGRVFRAAVSLFTDRVTATEVASIVGTVMAGLMALLGVYSLGTANPQPMLILIAGAVFLMGRAELAMVRGMEEQRRRGGRPVRIARPVFHGHDADPVDGWEWNPVDRTWTEWRAGYPVRRVAAD